MPTFHSRGQHPDGELLPEVLPPRTLQSTRQQPIYIVPAAPPNEDDSKDSLLNYGLIAWRYKWLLFAACLLGVVAALAMTLFQTPVYESKVSVEIQNVNENFMKASELDPTSGNYSADSYLQTQIRILQSESLVLRAKAKLAKQIPAEPHRPTALPSLRKTLGLPDEAPLTPEEEALKLAASSVIVRGSGITRVVEVSSASTRPALAAAFANAVANEYMQQNVENRWDTAQRTSDALAKNLEDMRDKLERSEIRLQETASRSGLVVTSDNHSLTEDKLKQLQDEILRAQADRASKQSRYEMAINSAPETVPEVLDNPALRDYQSKLTELRRQVAEHSATYTPAHPRLLRLQPQIEELRNSLDRERNDVIQRIKGEYEAALRREKLLQDAYQQHLRTTMKESAQGIQYNIVKREVETNREIYNAMLSKVKEAGIATSMKYNVARIVDPARPAEKPVSPNPILNLAGGLLGGALLGLGVIMIRERGDSTFQVPGDVSRYLNVPELGCIPSARLDPSVRRSRKTLPSGGRMELEPASVEGDVSDKEFAVWRRPFSMLSESFRATLASILLSRRHRKSSDVLVLTSCVSGEGKTLTSINLAIATAHVGKRVLLIDADVRRPRVHLHFGLPNSTGLTSLLESVEPLDEKSPGDVVHATPIARLSVLTSGEHSNRLAELLCSPRLEEVLHWCREHFDTIIIDTPPLMHVPDARFLGHASDGVIVVVRAGRVRREVAQSAVQRLEADGNTVVGGILNDWNPQSSVATSGYYNSSMRYYQQT